MNFKPIKYSAKSLSMMLKTILLLVILFTTINAIPVKCQSSDNQALEYDDLEQQQIMMFLTYLTKIQ